MRHVESRPRFRRFPRSAYLITLARIADEDEHSGVDRLGLGELRRSGHPLAKLVDDARIGILPDDAIHPDGFVDGLDDEDGLVTIGDLLTERK